MADKMRSSRIAAFKNTGKGTQDLRRKRAETSVALRRAARDEQLLKRRACSPDEDTPPAEVEHLPSPQEIVKSLSSEDTRELLSATRAARRTLSRQEDPPITEMIKAGVVPPLVKALRRDDCPDVQFEAAWAITNIASGTKEHTMIVIESGCVGTLVSLLGRGEALGEQCAWAVGNIAGDGAPARDLVLRHGALPALLPMLQPSQPLSTVRTAVWTLSNFCRNKDPLVDLEEVAPALPSIAQLLTVDDADTLSDTCWALSYLTDGPDDRIERVQSTPQLLSRLVAVLSHKSHAVRTPALRAVGNMLTGSDVQTDRCLDENVMQQLISLLVGDKPSLVKEAAWCVSNILAGTQTQIQRAIEAGVLPPLVRVLEVCEIKCQKEAAWSVTNLCLGGTGPQLCALLECGALKPYCALLASVDPRAVTVVLDGLKHLLQAAEKFGEVEQLCIKLEEDGALDKLEALQQHENEAIYKKTLFILDTYFAEAADEKNEPEKTEEEYKFGTADNFNGIGDF